MERATRNVLNGTMVAALAGGLLLSAQTPGDQYEVYYGLLHAHTAISDGSGTPEEAFKMAKETGLDFFAVTPHNHKAAESGAKDRKDGVLIANNQNLYNGNNIVQVTQKFSNGDENDLSIKPLLKAAAEISGPDFLAIYGQEFSTISKGNHMNVLGIDEVIRVSNGDFGSLLDLIKQQETPPVLQLNHPNVQSDLFYSGSNASTIKKKYDDYGIDADDLGPHYSNLVAKMDPYVHLLEIFSGPAMKRTRIENYRDDKAHYNDYYFYLRQGFHISPSAGQDNHYKTWGRSTDIRMGVYAKSLSKEDIYDAFRGQRTFVTEDVNSRIKVSINGTFMGSNLSANAETPLKVEVLFEDEDENGEEVEFTVYGGIIESQDSKKATNHKQRNNDYKSGTIITGERQVIFDVLASGNPEFYYVVVEQEDRNRTFSAPVWINYAKKYAQMDQSEIDDEKTLFVWSKASGIKYYHKNGCSSARNILAKNLEKSFDAPANRQLHECSIPQQDSH